jgi:hypothetical protein
MVVLTSLAGTCVPSGYVAKVSVSALAPELSHRHPMTVGSIARRLEVMGIL